MRPIFQRHFSNALYGVLDYAAYPVGMVLVAPVMLHHLCIARFGVWAVAAAVASIGSILASGFGDANIQQVATLRGSSQPHALLRTVRSSMGIHLVLGLVFALITWLLAPIVAGHVATAPSLRSDCLAALRIASLIILVRAVETVCVSTQRAFERYGSAVALSLAGRIASLLAAAALAFAGRSIATIMAASLALILLSLALQIRSLRTLLHSPSLLPLFDRDACTVLFRFGIFTWLQALASVIIGQADRLIAGVTMGAVAVASYALCVQIAQPLYGIVASGLHFLFPHLAARRLHSFSQEIRRTVALAILSNFLLVAIGASLLLLLGAPVLRLLAGPAIAQAAKPVLPLIVWSTALVSLSVTACYALMAFGRIRTVTILNLVGGATMLASMFWLIPRHGVDGIAAARFAYGVIGLILYIPLVLVLYPRLLARPGVGLSRYTRSRRNKRSTQPTHANVLGIRIEALNMTRALQRIASVLHSNRKGYVSVIGVHGIMEARRNPQLAAIYANSAITIPDGMPTVWVGHLQGCRQMQRVAGPDLMLEVFRSAQFVSYTHFLYGGDPGVAEDLAANLRRWFPWVRIVGTFTPPYRDLSPDEEADFISTIQHLQPDIIWTGISAPRQEQFMHRYLPVLDTRLMFGVGAAFDYHTGRIKDCSAWIKRAGLQWLHRLLQDPRRLWRRYLRNNPAFLCHIALQLTGLRTYGPIDDQFVETRPAASRALPPHVTGESRADLPAANLVSRL
jgi:exopolysaccharide biosynthesis WecB/TagA/CpsF family protein